MYFSDSCKGRSKIQCSLLQLWLYYDSLWVLLHDSKKILEIRPLMKRVKYLDSIFPKWFNHTFLSSSGEKNTITYCVHAKSLQLCLTLCNPVDCSLPESSVHGILQARILKWVAMPSSRGSSQPRDGTHFSYVSCIGRRVPYHYRHLEAQLPSRIFLNIILMCIKILLHNTFFYTFFQSVKCWQFYFSNKSISQGNAYS